MTYDLLNQFYKYFENNKVVVDNYKIADGYYYLFKGDGTYKKLIIKNNESDDFELYNYFITRDLYSKYLNSNKPVDTIYTETIGSNKYTMAKKICSNNIYTLFFKNKAVLGLCNNDSKKDAVPLEVFIKGINKYYCSLSKIGSKNEEKELLDKFYSEEEMSTYNEKMQNAFIKVHNDLSNEELPKEVWIKIFFEEDEDEYIRVSNIYFAVKLFNSNSNNVKIENQIYGVNNYNYGLNSKKPFLELRTTPYIAGSLVSRNDIKILNNIFMWLYNVGVRENIITLPIDWEFNGLAREKENTKNKSVYLIRATGNNGVARIDDFQYISNFSEKIKLFICKDYIRKTSNTFKTENIYRLEFYTSNIWISGNQNSEKNYLRDSYYDFDKKISKSLLTNWKKEFLRANSYLFFELFQKEDERNYIDNIDKVIIPLIENTIIEELEKGKGYINSAVSSLNLLYAYKIYFNKKGEDLEMKINNIQETCYQIYNKIEKIETDEQYYYFMGQIAFYLLNQSKASKLTQDNTEPFIKAVNIKKLKDELKFLYEKFNHEIYLNNPKFNNILSQLLIMEPDSKVKDNKDILLAGLLGNNVFYNKKEIENGGNEDGKND